MSSDPNAANIPASQTEQPVAESADRFSRGAEAVINVQKHNLDAAADLAADSANLFRQSVEAGVEIQKNVLDAAVDSFCAAAQYGQRAFQLWNRTFWLAVTAPVAMTTEFSERGNLLGWRQRERARREEEKAA
ncbi:MAG: hypothetical protein ACE14M_06800 [Terriglobales bacterium]